MVKEARQRGASLNCLQLAESHSQAELAEHVGGDGRQISRYENDRITPSLDALARIAEYLDTSLDHLVFDNIPRPTTPHHRNNRNRRPTRPHHRTTTKADHQALLDHLDALLTRTRLQDITNNSETANSER